jgi:hypothetical protein
MVLFEFLRGLGAIISGLIVPLNTPWNDGIFAVSSVLDSKGFCSC